MLYIKMRKNQFGGEMNKNYIIGGLLLVIIALIVFVVYLLRSLQSNKHFFGIQYTSNSKSMIQLFNALNELIEVIKKYGCTHKNEILQQLQADLVQLDPLRALLLQPI